MIFFIIAVSDSSIILQFRRNREINVCSADMQIGEIQHFCKLQAKG
jgi:hypothetical protein